MFPRELFGVLICLNDIFVWKYLNTYESDYHSRELFSGVLVNTVALIWKKDKMERRSEMMRIGAKGAQQIRAFWLCRSALKLIYDLAMISRIVDMVECTRLSLFHLTTLKFWKFKKKKKEKLWPDKILPISKLVWPSLNLLINWTKF